MKIRILGAHNIESRDTRHVCLLIDDTIAVEAGALTSGLSFAEQMKLAAVLLTHQHFDHIRDIPAIGMNFRLQGKQLALYGTQPVYEALTAHLINQELYPNFIESPPDNPSLRFTILEPGNPVKINGYTVLPVPVKHAVPATGLQVTAPDGKTVFYTADTGPGLADCWRQVKPELLVIEVTAPNSYEEFARQSGHLTPALLHDELESFREIRGYLPRVVLVHLNPLEEDIIRREIDDVARSLGTDIEPGHEGMQLEL